MKQVERPVQNLDGFLVWFTNIIACHDWCAYGFVAEVLLYLREYIANIENRMDSLTRISVSFVLPNGSPALSTNLLSADSTIVARSPMATNGFRSQANYSVRARKCFVISQLNENVTVMSIRICGG